jgi:exopolysaccharide biosynthesis predicted pyruvyltransferase EpsI
MTAAAETIRTLAGVIDQVLEPLVPASSRCALIGYPFHGNVGDSAIWLGQKRWLAKRGVDIVYEADLLSFRETAVRALPPDVSILLMGGGNYGDVWPLVQTARVKMLRAVHDRHIVEMPQTVHFSNEGNLTKTRELVRQLPDYTLICRDNRGLEFAQANLECDTALCPDMALVLGPQQAPVEPEVDVVWLSRTDKESAGLQFELPAGVTSEDWITDPPHPLHEKRWLALRNVLRTELPDKGAMREFQRINDALAEARLARGLRLLSRGHGVVTDRLHGHILSMLLGKPHVLLDNSYGKNGTFYDSWTSDCDLAEMTDPSEASAAAIIESLKRRIG